MAKVDHKPSQNERIIDYMRKYGGITPLDAIRDLGVMRLASRISDMRRLGYSIIDEWVSVENRWGEKVKVKSYRLEERGVYDEVKIKTCKNSHIG